MRNGNAARRGLLGGGLQYGQINLVIFNLESQRVGKVIGVLRMLEHGKVSGNHHGAVTQVLGQQNGGLAGKLQRHWNREQGGWRRGEIGHGVGSIIIGCRSDDTERCGG